MPAENAAMNSLIDETSAEPKIGAARQAAFIFIFATVLLDMLRSASIIPVLPKLVVDFMGGDTEAAAKMFGIFGTAWALMQFLFSPRPGRVVRPVRPTRHDPDLQSRHRT